jgi:hypothetical protein
MSEIQLAHFAFGGERADQSRFHDVALREARATTDHRDAAVEPTRPSFATRFRLALAGGAAATPEACTCPA